MKAPFAQRRRAIALFKHDLAHKDQQRANQRKWLKATAWLGDRHVLAQPVPRVPPSDLP